MKIKILENIDKIHVFRGMRFSSRHIKLYRYIRLEPKVDFTAQMAVFLMFNVLLTVFN